MVTQQLTGKFYLDGELVGEMPIVHFISEEYELNCICSEKYWEHLITDMGELDMTNKNFNIDIYIYLVSRFFIPWLPKIVRVKQYYSFMPRKQLLEDMPIIGYKGIMRLDIDKKLFKLTFGDKEQYRLYKKRNYALDKRNKMCYNIGGK